MEIGKKKLGTKFQTCYLREFSLTDKKHYLMQEGSKFGGEKG
jgi:hypothetical protein